MAGYLDKLKNIVRFAQVTGPADNEAQFPVQQMTFKKKVVNVVQVFPYGLYSNVSSEDSLGVMFSIDGSENNRAAISYTPQKRPTDLEQNEVALYHPQTNSFIKFRNNGDLEISAIEGESTGSIIFNCENITVNANANVEVNCTDATVTASSSATVDSPSTTITGDLDANGTTSLNGGNAIAREGDTVEVTITSGSSSGTWQGTITSGGSNTSA